ncbi:EamA family transporter [Pseudonocardia acaciae]|uniref:EamA family transporter n=1 Tax=Pseudonocardia acaciae TaxID=551276 RepID=UPI000491F63E|nr:EamA family transporter [Pseudonocardia acaciae]
MPILLAGVAAATFGVADFLGGTAARRVSSAVVATLAQVAGLVMLLAVVLVVLPATPLTAALVWGALAGTAGGIGVPMLYKALAAGPMNVVAPLAALTSAVVPVLVGTLLGDRPSALAWVGIALAVIAGTVVGAATPGSREPSAGVRGTVRGAALALLAGACFGGFFTLLAQAPAGAGLWPVTVARLTGTLVAAVVLVAALREGGPRWSGTGWRLAVLCGVLDAGANALYLLAAQRGQLAVVGAIVALYPASTVLLARLLHGERIGPLQRVGLALAVPALVLVGAG